MRKTIENEFLLLRNLVMVKFYGKLKSYTHFEQILSEILTSLDLSIDHARDLLSSLDQKYSIVDQSTPVSHVIESRDHVTLLCVFIDHHITPCRLS